METNSYILTQYMAKTFITPNRTTTSKHFLNNLAVIVLLVNNKENSFFKTVSAMHKASTIPSVGTQRLPE